MDKATPTPASVDSVMALAKKYGNALACSATDTRELQSALRAEVERLAAQAAPTVKWQNGCNETAPAALRFLAENERPAGGQQDYNSEHLYQIADELEATYRAAQPSRAPVVQATSEPHTWHDLKTDPDAWDAVAAGIKTHEIRLDDRGFAVGDGLRLRKTRYTGHEMRAQGKPLEYIGQPIERIVSHIQRGYGLDQGWCILSFADRASRAPAVRMLTEDEAESVWGRTGLNRVHYAADLIREFCAVNAGKRIPPDGKIGGAA